MGEVYRARDTRLDRVVAFKILSPNLADQPAHRERFRREARAISSLSHPHICALYDVGEQDHVSFLVMEYLDGETLTARLLRGPLPRDQVVQRATEIAGALDHAHRQGIVHRDLKPGNVMLTSAGAKLLDFGLAKLHQRGLTVVAETVTIAGAATVEGSIVGTVQYMAPEQLEGKDVDARTDVFAFGALVYEMATGRKAFTGGSQASLIAAILRAEAPRLSSIDPLTSASLDHVITRCLAKDPDERWQTTRDLMIELREAARRDSSVAAAQEKTAERTSTDRRPIERDTLTLRTIRERLAWVVAIVATGVALGVAMLYVQSKPPIADPSAAAVRSEIPAPEGTIVGSIALSPNGRRLVFVGRTGLTARLWIRALDSVTAQPLADTEGADYPFWSPDGASIGFFADGKLKRMDVAGGSPQTLADAPNARGGAWSRTGTIVFSPNSQTLHRVPATGGSSQEVTALDVSRGDISHRWPSFLPDGQHFLYLAQSSIPENRGLFIASLDKSTKKFVVRTEESGAYVDPGYLLFLRERTLMAQRFRDNTLEVEGNAVPLANPVAVNGLERAQFEISSGALVYRRGAFLGGTEVSWLDRGGRQLATVGMPADFRGVRLSPDGRHIALVIEDQRVGTPDVWVHDVARNVATRFTFDPGTDRDPVWSADSGLLAVRSNRNDRFNVYVRAVNGVGGERLLYESNENVNIHDWSRDGSALLVTRVDSTGKTGRDLWILPLTGSRPPYPLLPAPLNQDYPRFSPSGRLLSYQTDDSGRNKVYVMTYSASGDRWEISPEGGVQPIWRADGKELFYVASDNSVMAVDVRETAAAIEFGTPRRLFQAAIAIVAARQPNWTWDVSADGQRFLFVLTKDDPAPLTLVTNWRTDLEGQK
jgi:Tol biopolymer transport system component